MNISDKWMNELLLDQSGELPRWRQWRLQRRMQRDPDLQREQTRLQALQTTAQSAALDIPLSDFCMSQIRKAAEDQVARWQSQPTARRKTVIWRPAFVSAGVAAFLLLAGLWFRLPPETDLSGVALQQVERAAEWVPAEWDAIFSEIAWNIEEQLSGLWTELNDVVWLTDRDEDEWARELIEMETST